MCRTAPTPGCQMTDREISTRGWVLDQSASTRTARAGFEGSQCHGVGEQVHDHQLHAACVGGKRGQPGLDVVEATPQPRPCRSAGQRRERGREINLLLVRPGASIASSVGRAAQRAGNLRSRTTLRSSVSTMRVASASVPWAISSRAATCRTLSAGGFMADQAAELRSCESGAPSSCMTNERVDVFCCSTRSLCARLSPAPPRCSLARRASRPRGREALEDLAQDLIFTQ